jgi:hypothetical protein
MIGPDTKIVAFGSCFASNITEWLAKRNFSVLTKKDGEHSNAYIVRFGEGMVNTSVIRQQFEWAFEGKTWAEELWHGYDAKAFGYDDEVRKATLDIFDSADFFIITLGLSEVWYDEVSGGVFWRAVPKDKFNPARHKFRSLSVAENKENIKAIIDIIARYKPSAKVIFTLSPIPLVATFRAVSCITANSSSKASLRVALDETIRDVNSPNVHYWPSYEIVTEAFERRWKADRRHVKDQILDYIMTLFETVWCHGSRPEMTVEEAWLRARAADGAIPAFAMKAIDDDNAHRLTMLVHRLTRKGAQQEVGLIEDLAKQIAISKPNSKIAAWSRARPSQPTIEAEAV